MMPLPVPNALPHDRQVRLEVELEHAQRLAHVGGRRRDRDQRQDGVALLDVILDPFLVDRDVALEEAEPLLREQVRDAVGLHVHSVDLPVRRIEDAPREMMADEAVDAEDQDSSHESSERLSEWDFPGARPSRSSRLGPSVGIASNR